MRFLRSIAGYTLRDHIRSEVIRESLEVENILEVIKKYRVSWREHVRRMPDSRIPKAIWEYETVGKRRVGRPKKRWKDQPG